MKLRRDTSKATKAAANKRVPHGARIFRYIKLLLVTELETRHLTETDSLNDQEPSKTLLAKKMSYFKLGLKLNSQNVNVDDRLAKPNGKWRHNEVSRMLQNNKQDLTTEVHKTALKAEFTLLNEHGQEVISTKELKLSVDL